MQSSDEDLKKVINEINSLGGKILKKILEGTTTLVSSFPDVMDERIDILDNGSVSTFYLPPEERFLFLSHQKEGVH